MMTKQKPQATHLYTQRLLETHTDKHKHANTDMKKFR